MSPKELLSYWRDQVHDTKKPYLWTDAEALRYMNLAYFEWVGRIGGLRDSTSSAASITLPANVDTYELDPKVIRVLSARIPATGLPVRVVNPQSPEGLNT